MEDAVEHDAEGMSRVETGPMVQAYWDAYAKVAGITAPFEPWWFGSKNDPEQLTSLGRLVSDGPKRATTAVLADYEADGEPLPVGGEFGVVVDGEGTPLCIVRMTRVDVVAFGDVTEEFAWVEGEGDRSLAYWRAAHIRFFQGLGTPPRRLDADGAPALRRGVARAGLRTALNSLRASITSTRPGPGSRPRTRSPVWTTLRPMRILRFTAQDERPIEGRPYETVGAFATPLGHGSGDGRTYIVRFEPGGRIGPHLTGFGQLLIVVEGSGWVEQDGHRVSVGRQEAAYFPKGVVHSKGSDAGMTAVMVQLLDLELGPPDDD